MKIRGRNLDWTNTLFLLVVHLTAVIGTILYTVLHGWTWAAVGIGVAWFVMTGLSITAGYHRLFSHGTYRAHPALRAFYLIFGAAAFQQDALKWSAGHRRHHAYVDEDADPYSIRKGFWWAHVLWILVREPKNQPGGKIGDLQRDPLMRIQKEWYVPIGVFVSFTLPAFVGALLGDMWGGLIIGGFFRLVFSYHMTWSINSVAHTLGKQPYNDSDSSRDSSITALLSLGEGYHNYHHSFPIDYRNGIRAWHFDPSKWWIRLMSYIGVTKDLVRVPQDTILKARVRMQAVQAESWLVDQPVLAEHLQAARLRLEQLVEEWGDLKAQLIELKSRTRSRSREAVQNLRIEVKEARSRYRAAYREWVWSLQNPHLISLPA
jgi:stearoyl-CoA desaturase (delta-9 desaturase)